ncbi:hypothetical protein LZU96_15100 [Pantoea agglomerans]|uniref:hypothetical protein n=1 Tax=Enterobacter agglomerans TaxID=549 RepID=UPI001F430DA4|nr:hypothetical protein [Pantoea agglomerans]UIL51545.1 hypothetical protein LZU96_15100 [Pantoea agglomerans]
MTNNDELERQVLSIMRIEQQEYWRWSRGEYYHSMPTFLIKDHYNRTNPENETDSATLRKLLTDMAKRGLVEKCYRSRIGQAFWTLPRGKQEKA